ncbi:hypothetical protein CXB51_024369 [Gossypium anomalum]|uniref:Zinc finger BED domain-containing protein RICESLEEPER 2-like n=1 Tax=Gossypium anomalum TaxID=47600 RepID=A0A8J5YG94_9ROSI|nr:hypothetical protein CXB51_024369 [Gossypium anomalum]
MESTSGSTTNLNNHVKTCLKRPRRNTSNPQQSELAFVNVSQETMDLSTWVFDKDAIRKALRISYMVLTAHWVDDEWSLIVQYGITDASVSVDRVIGAVRYIRVSPLRLTKFNQRVKEEMIDRKAQLCLDVPTRWNSTYMMLKVAEKYERAFKSYVRDDHNFFLDLNTGDGVPTFDDWKLVRKVIKVLELFYHLTLNVSGSLHVTSHSLFEVLTDVHCLFDGWQDCGDLEIISMTSKMRDKYNKYWGEGNKINMLVYLTVIFYPRCKMSFLDFGVNLLFPNIANDIMKMIDKELHCLFNEYSFNAGRIQLFEYRSSSSTNLCSSMEIDQSEIKTGLAKQKYLKKKKQVGFESKFELDRYLGEDKEVKNSSSFDLLLWWKMNSLRFPILAQMARDILAIPISTVASKSAFSTGGRVLDSFRSSLTPLMVEALVCTQDWLWKSNDAINLEDYVDELQTMEDGKI